MDPPFIDGLYWADLLDRFFNVSPNASDRLKWYENKGKMKLDLWVS